MAVLVAHEAVVVAGCVVAEAAPGEDKVVITIPTRGRTMNLS